MGPMLLPMLTFLAVLCGVGAVYSLLSDLFLRDRARVSDRIDDEFRSGVRERVKKTSLFKDLGKVAAESLDGVVRKPPNLREKVELFIERSGLQTLSVQKLLTFTAVLGLVLGIVGFFVAGWIAGLILLAAGAALPWLYVRHKLLARQEALRAQLPDSFDLMARALRAGQTMAQAMQSVADELTGPISYEFTVCYEQQNLGLPPDDSLRDLARRTGLMELNIFAVAVVVQRQVGGNLSEMLEKLANLIRDRFRIRGLIQTLTAEGRLQAMVLMGLPPLILAIMLVLNPEYALDLFKYPALLVGIVVCDAIGGLWIRKIVNFDF